MNHRLDYFCPSVDHFQLFQFYFSEYKNLSCLEAHFHLRVSNENGNFLDNVSQIVTSFLLQLVF